MITSVESFIKYFEGVRRRTLRDIAAIPPEYVDWAPRPGEMTLGDLIRHLGSIERFYVTKVVEDRWAYPGHERAIAPDLTAAVAYLNRMHAEAMADLAKLPDAELEAPRESLDGYPVRAWRFLMVMIEHEVHHRSQIDSYLSALGIPPPQIFGWHIEDIVARIHPQDGGPSVDTTSRAE